MRSSTSVGFQPEGDGSQTYALRSAKPQINYSPDTVDIFEKHTLRASDDSSGTRCNVDTCYSLVVSLELILQGELVPRPAVELNVIISGHG